jgi:hypothetical protein
VPRPPLDGLIDDLYYLKGTPPYCRLSLPPMPSAVLIVNLGAPFRISASTDVEPAEYADGVVITTLTQALHSATRQRRGQSACTSSRGGWRRSYRCLRPSCATGL